MHQNALVVVRRGRIVVAMEADDIRLVIEGRAAASTGRGRRLRTSARISQREFARFVGVSQVSIHRWERGDHLPTGARAVAYARALREVAAEAVAHA
jgi:DNA-binding transcriptional regulator YiaG